MKTTCAAIMSMNGPAERATSTRFSAIIVITRNSDRQTPEIRSDARSSSRMPANGTRLRMATPIIMHQRKLGIVMAPPEKRAAIHWPATTAAKMPARTPIVPTVVMGRARSSSSAEVALAAACERSLNRVMRYSATGPAMMPPMISPIVATVIDSSITAWRLFTSAKRSA